MVVNENFLKCVLNRKLELKFCNMKKDIIDKESKTLAGIYWKYYLKTAVCGALLFSLAYCEST